MQSSWLGAAQCILWHPCTFTQLSFTFTHHVLFCVYFFLAFSTDYKFTVIFLNIISNNLLSWLMLSFDVSLPVLQVNRVHNKTSIYSGSVPRNQMNVHERRRQCIWCSPVGDRAQPGMGKQQYMTEWCPQCHREEAGVPVCCLRSSLRSGIAYLCFMF